jgi:N-methylhydantoinase A/oxoprolinase/acetone carboxylase beta subunit
MDFLHTEPPLRWYRNRWYAAIPSVSSTTAPVLVRLDEADARAAIAALLSAGIESLAVCLLWSFRNPVHEQRLREIACELALDLPVSLSCEIARAWASSSAPSRRCQCLRVAR